MKKKLQILSLFLFIGLISLFMGCDFYKPLKIGDIQGVEMQSFEGTNLKFNLLIPIENKNSYAITIKDYDLDIQLNQIQLGHATMQTDLTIPRNSNSVQSFPVEASLKDTFSGAIALISVFTKKKIVLTAVGELNAKVLFVSKTIPINEQTEVAFLK